MPYRPPLKANFIRVTNIFCFLGGSTGLVVMGRDSCSKGREFESWCHILDGHFSHLFVAKIVICV